MVRRERGTALKYAEDKYRLGYSAGVLTLPLPLALPYSDVAGPFSSPCRRPLPCPASYGAVYPIEDRCSAYRWYVSVSRTSMMEYLPSHFSYARRVRAGTQDARRAARERDEGCVRERRVESGLFGYRCGIRCVPPSRFAHALTF